MSDPAEPEAPGPNRRPRQPWMGRKGSAVIWCNKMDRPYVDTCVESLRNPYTGEYPLPLRWRCYRIQTSQAISMGYPLVVTYEGLTGFDEWFSAMQEVE